MTYRDPVAEVFRLPELVSLIVQHCLEPYTPGERKQYWHLACVSQRWRDPVMSIAWRLTDLHKLFAARIEPDWRQYYANQVRHLRIIYPENMNEQLSTLSFRNLESVIICERPDGAVLAPAELWIHTLLGPSLRSLVLLSEVLASQDLSHAFAERCPGLTTLRIKLRENDPGSVSILTGIVNALPRLYKLKLDSRLDASTSASANRLLGALSSLSHLELLEFEGIIPDLREISTPFPQLRSLRGEVTLPSLLRVGLVMPLLVHLAVDLPPRNVTDLPKFVIAPLSSLTKLESLTLRVQGDAPLQGKDLEALANFSNLSRLYIGDAVRRKALAPDFTDEMLCGILRSLPLLVSVELRIRHPSGGQALLTAMKHCPNLRALYIPGHYDLLPFASLPQQPAFPELGTLCVASLFFRHARPNYQISRAEFKSIHEVLAQHAPKLSYMDFADPCWKDGKLLSATLRRGWDASCACGEPVEEHRQVDHIARDVEPEPAEPLQLTA